MKKKSLFKEKPNKENYENYKYILAKIQTLVLKKETDTKEKIKTWETDFMLKN